MAQALVDGSPLTLNWFAHLTEYFPGKTVKVLHCHHNLLCPRNAQLRRSGFSTEFEQPASHTFCALSFTYRESICLRNAFGKQQICCSMNYAKRNFIKCGILRADLSKAYPYKASMKSRYVRGTKIRYRGLWQSVRGKWKRIPATIWASKAGYRSSSLGTWGHCCYFLTCAVEIYIFSVH